MVKTTSTRTDWPKCDKCNRKVTTKSGVLVLAIGDGGWQWGHIRCMPQRGYSISADTFDTEIDARNWAEYLLNVHTWYSKTNWREMWKRFYDIDTTTEEEEAWLYTRS